MTEITLQLQYPLTVEYAAKHADLCVEGAKQIDGVNLDYSVESLEYLDSLIESWRSEAAGLQDIATVLFTVGCYLGEVLVRNAGAAWVEPEQGENETFPLLIQFEDGTVSRPIDHVFKRFEDPEEGDFLPDFYEETIADAGDEKELVAVLRTLGANDELEKTAVHKKVADDLAIFACRKVETKDNIIAIDYVLKDELAQGEVDENTLIEYCYENFFNGKIEINAYEQEGDEMLSFEHEEGLVSAILGHHTSYSQFSEMLKCSDITILIVNPDNILATKKGSSFEAGFRQILQDVKDEIGPMHLVPGIYNWTDGKLTRVRE